MTSTFKRKKYTTAIGRRIPSIRLGPPPLHPSDCPRTLSTFLPAHPSLTLYIRNIRNRVGRNKRGRDQPPLLSSNESDLLRNVSPRISLPPLTHFPFLPLFLPHAHVRTQFGAAGSREFLESSLSLSSPLLISRSERTSGKPWVVEAARTRRGCIRVQ